MDKDKIVKQIAKGRTDQYAKEALADWNRGNKYCHWWMSWKLNWFFIHKKFKKIQVSQTVWIFFKAYYPWTSKQFFEWNEPWAVVFERWGQSAMQLTDWRLQRLQRVWAAKNNRTRVRIIGKWIKPGSSETADGLHRLICSIIFNSLYILFLNLNQISKKWNKEQ